MTFLYAVEPLSHANSSHRHMVLGLLEKQEIEKSTTCRHYSKFPLTSERPSAIRKRFEKAVAGGSKLEYQPLVIPRNAVSATTDETAISG